MNRSFKTRMKIYKTAHGHIQVPMYDKDAAIACSGGADSSLLLWMLVSNGFVPRIFFLNDANAKLVALENVCANLELRYGKKLNIERHDRVSEGHWIKPDIINLQDKTYYLYDGITKNPPEESGVGGSWPLRPVGNRNPKFITPFLHYDKRAVLAIYREYNLEWLYDQTWSCTQNFDLACRHCFACQERNWAYAEIYS